MSNKNQVIAIVISFLIAGFYLLPTPSESGVPPNGDMGCCQLEGPACLPNVIPGGDCSEFVPPGGVFIPGETCNFGTGECVPLPAQFGCCSVPLMPEGTIEECTSFEFECVNNGGTFCAEVDQSCSAAGQACTCPPSTLKKNIQHTRNV